MRSRGATCTVLICVEVQNALDGTRSIRTVVYVYTFDTELFLQGGAHDREVRHANSSPEQRQRNRWTGLADEIAGNSLSTNYRDTKTR